MMLKKLTPDLMVKDVNKTVDFYKEILGFEFVMGVPKDSQEVTMEMPKDKQLIFAAMKCGEVEIMFDNISGDIPLFKDMDIGGSLTLYIEVDNIKELFEKLKGKIEIVKELHDTFYGMQEFYIKDCNGYVLEFSEKK